MALKTSRADFEKIFPSLAEDILDDARKYNLPPNALEWFQRVCPEPRLPATGDGHVNAMYSCSL